MLYTPYFFIFANNETHMNVTNCLLPSIITDCMKPGRLKIDKVLYRLGAITFLVFLCPSISHAQAPKYSNEFMAIGVGARSLGMSNAMVASVNDATAGYWNPAGLLRIESNIQLALMHAEYFAGIAKYDYASFATPIDSNSALGMSLIRFGVDDIPNTTELIDANGNVDFDRITSFSAVDYGFLLSYARKAPFLPGLRYGVNAKVIHRKVGDFARAWGFGLELGAQYEWGPWQFGVMGRDLTSTFNAWSYSLSDQMQQVFAATGNEIPENSLEITLPRFQFGAARMIEFKQKFSLLAELNVDITSDGKRNVLIAAHTFSADPHMGLELGYNKMIFLRGGVGNIQKVTNLDGEQERTFQPNLGLGLKLKRLSIDYAMTDIGDQSVAIYSNIFSLKLDIVRTDK